MDLLRQKKKISLLSWGVPGKEMAMTLVAPATPPFLCWSQSSGPRNLIAIANYFPLDFAAAGRFQSILNQVHFVLLAHRMFKNYFILLANYRSQRSPQPKPPNLGFCLFGKSEKTGIPRDGSFHLLTEVLSLPAWLTLGTRTATLM